jgi:integrase
MATTRRCPEPPSTDVAVNATPRPRRFRPLTAAEAGQFLQAASGDRLHALYELTLHTKTRASERRTALPTECIHSLKSHREHQQEERQAAGTGWTDNGLVFTTATGSPLDPTDLTRGFGRLLRRAGLRHTRFHDLRHSTATLLLEQVDLVVVKELLGHAHIGVTAGVYAQVQLRLQRRAVDVPRHRPQPDRRRPWRLTLRGHRPLTLPSALPSNR